MLSTRVHPTHEACADGLRPSAGYTSEPFFELRRRDGRRAARSDPPRFRRRRPCIHCIAGASRQHSQNLSTFEISPLTVTTFDRPVSHPVRSLVRFSQLSSNPCWTTRGETHASSF